MSPLVFDSAVSSGALSCVLGSVPIGILPPAGFRTLFPPTPMDGGSQLSSKRPLPSAYPEVLKEEDEEEEE